MLDVMKTPPPVVVGVEWIACRVRMPDADATVQMFLPEDEEEPVIDGWWDGETWRCAASGGELGDVVTWWAEKTRPPAEPHPDHLWCVHIEGPDDVIPAPSRHEAEAAAWLLNAAWARMPANDPNTPRLQARAERWPYSDTAHQCDRAQFRDLLTAQLQVAW